MSPNVKRGLCAGWVALGALLVVLGLPGAATATTPTGADGLVTEADVGGLTAAAVRPGSLARWVAALPAPVRGRAATGVLRSAGRSPVTLVTRSVLSASAGDAARLLVALRRRSGLRWARDDADAARMPGAQFRRGAAVVFASGPVVGRVAVAGLPRGLARAAVREAAAAVIARLRALQAETVWEQVSRPATGRAETTRALQAFSIAFDVRVPGVSVPPGRLGTIGDATVALWRTLGRLDAMSAAQRAVVRRVVASLRAPRTAGVRARAAGTDGWTASAPWQQEAQAAATVLGARLGFPLTLPLRVGTQSSGGGTALAVTQPESAQGAGVGVPNVCFITVFPSGQATAGVYRVEIITHEVFHCFQAQMANDLGFLAKRVGMSWVIEGGADWAACQAVPSPVVEPAFTTWLASPGTPLPDRAYDGVGFFTLLSVNGIDVWARWPQIVKSADTAAAFAAAVGPEHDRIRDGWAASLLQDPARGAGWDPGQPACRPASHPPKPHDVFLTDGQTASLTAPAFAARLLRLRADADVLHVTVPGGKLRVSSTAPAADLPGLGDRYLCVDAQSTCGCPHGSTRANDPPPQKVDADGGTVLALTGAETGTAGKVKGMTREEYCGVKLGRIVPGRSIGDVFLSQTRRSLLKKVAGLVPIERGFTTATANGLLLRGPAVAGDIHLQIHFGLCSSPALPPSGGAACRSQFTESTPDQVGSVQTFSDAFTTSGGLGPGSAAGDVVAAIGEQYCQREERQVDPQNAPWRECDLPGGGGRTHWGFDTAPDHNTVLAVAVYNPRSFPD